MAPFGGRRAGALSGGMKQKLALMCTLLHRPKVLLLDEPTTGVDPVSRRDFWVILEQLAGEGIAILLTTAYLDEAERCGRVGLMHSGRLLRCAPPEELKREFRKRGLMVRRVGATEAVRPDEPTLEDVFIAFVEHSGEEAR